jgi:transcriptional regulator with XRE-family HTH domain
MNSLVNTQKTQCLDCESHNVRERVLEQQFQYGTGENSVMLKAMVPVLSCVDCGYESFDERGEQARHGAVCRYLGVHTPEELVHLRKRAGLSRAEGCSLTGFGIASWQRWESGVTPPNTSSDRLLYLLQFPENIQRLEERRRHAQASEKSQNNLSQDEISGIRSRDRFPRHSFKRFERFANPQRVTSQAQGWNLRKQ